MMKYLKTFLNSALLIITISLFFIPSVAFADDFSGSTSEVCGGVGTVNGTTTTTNNQTADSGCGTNNASDLKSILTFVLDLLSVIVGVVSVIMIVVAGVKFVLSGGEPQQVSGAKNTIIFAVVGLVVAALAQVIVRFVVANIGSKIK